MRKVSLVLIILSIFRIGIGSVETIPGNENLNEDKRAINELKVRLGLDESQVVKLEQIFSAAESQKKIDVDLFKTSATALIRAAERRRTITDTRIMDLLKDVQKNNYEIYLKGRQLEDELFRIKNGLLLSDTQLISIELIISEYRDSLDRLYKKLDYYIKSGQDRKNNKSESARLMSGKSQGLEGRTPEMRKLEMGPPGKIRDLQDEKAKQIRKHLTDKQKLRYKEYLEYEERQFQILIKKMQR